MKLFLSMSACVLGALSVSLSAAPLTDYIESDVELFMSARSIADSREAWEQHPIREVFEDPKLQQLFAKVFEDEALSDEDERSSFTAAMQDEFGLEWDDFFELFPGEIAIAFYNLSGSMVDELEADEILLIAEFSGDEDRLNELMQIQFERNAKSHKEMNPSAEHVMIEESFMGETLYMDEAFNGEDTYIEDGYALVDGIFLLATEERLRQTVELIKEGGDSISTTAEYQRATEASGQRDLQVYINLKSLLEPINDLMVASAMEGGLAMFGVSGESLNSALALDALLGLFVDFELTDNGVLSYGGLIYREKVGLLRLLTYGGGSLPEATYVPEGVFASSVSTFDFGAMLAELEKVFATASPSVPMLLDIQLQQVKNNSGVDLRRSILDNLDSDAVSLTTIREASRESAIPLTEQVYVVQLKDAESLSQAFEALKDLVPGVREMIQTQEYEGEVIHTFATPTSPAQSEAGANDVSYVITRSELIISMGRVGLLQEVLSRRVTEEDGFWQMEEIQEAFESIAQPGAVTRSYADLEQMVKPMMQSMVLAMSASGLSPVDQSDIPNDLKLPFRVISESNEADDGLFMRTLIYMREAGE